MSSAWGEDMQAISMKADGGEDRSKIVGLLETVEGWPGFEHGGSNEDFWEWRYKRNPLGPAFTCHVWRGEDITANAGGLRTELAIGGSVRRAAQWSDLYTHPDHRGQGMAQRAVKCLEDQERNGGVHLDFAFPSATGYEVVKGRGFREMPVRFAQYELITNPERFFANVRMGQMKRVAYEVLRMIRVRSGDESGVTTMVADHFPEDIEALTTAFGGRFDMVLHRSRAYLEWRYADPVGGKFILLFARRDERTAGYAVLRPYAISGKPYMDIIDLVALPEDVPALRSMLRTAVAISQEHGSDLLQMWLPTTHPFATELGRMGFFLRQPVQGERLMRLMVRPLVEDAALKEIMGRPHLKYHMVLGDTDWV
ncbi:GNAT family N-acetyltransferase [Methanomassiliicoccus luminyensis]|jgi:GNAT superfamily N-acetyltransferase|uniref:GNAT family N-acetyltransferase n=1 Tax=Methanomassiliicoccus luminyensis TaxID=1080712 RepID=UPI00036EE16D|nr:GNAT family N-acetyltransferase [Methanomassiliicoccus luminyensis]